MENSDKDSNAMLTQKNAEEFELKYKSIVHLISDWVWEIDEYGKYIYCSEKVEQILGYTVDEIYGKSPFDFMTKEECERVVGMFANIVEAKKPIVDLENWNIHKDGHKVCLLTSGIPVFNDTGRFTGYKGIDKDITIRKLAEAALTESEERWSFALEGAGDGVWDWNAITNTVHFSLQWKAMLGYQDHEIGTTLDEWSKRIHPEDENQVFEDVNKLFKKETTIYHNEHRVLCKDGSYKWVLARGKVFHWTDDGKPQRIIGTHTDISERKRFENLIRNNELILRTVADHTYTWEYWIGENKQINYMSPSCERITGYTREEFIRDPSLLQTIVHPDDSAPFNCHHETAFSNEQSNDHTQFEVRFLHKNGSIVDIQHICRPIFDELHKYLGRRVSNRDITEQKRTDEKLHQLSQAVEQSPVSIVISDTAGAIQYVNPKFVECTGYSFDEVQGKNPRLLNSGYTSQADYNNLWTNLKSGLEWKGEFHNKKKNGDFYWESAKISPIINAAGKITHFLAVKEDITELKKAEKKNLFLYKISESVHTTESLYELFERIHKGLKEILVANNFFIALVNDEENQITYPYGVDEKSIDLTKSISLNDTQSLSIEVIKTQRSLLLVEDELKERYSTGKTRLWGSLPKCWLGIPLILKGRSIGVFVLQDYYNIHAYCVNDIALLESTAKQIALAIERKRSEYSLLKSNRDLTHAYETVAAASKLKSEFVANMSHEIRTPINGIMGLTNLLLQTEVDEEQHSYLSLINNSSSSLMTIINDILDFSKIEAGKLTIERIEFDLQHLVEETVALIRPRIDEKGLDLLLKFLPDTQVRFIGDPNRVRQVITNLLGNAIKFTPHGTITIVVSKQEQYDNSSVIRFTITDTGIGIPEQSLGKIFQSFVQGNGSTTREYGGTGLGLAISQRLVELMGGTIGVESSIDKGSTFWFTATMLDIKSIQSNSGTGRTSEHQPEGISEKSTDNTSANGKKDIKILVAEDNFANQAVCKGMLRKLGYTSTIVCNGSEAVNEFKRNAYDIVLMDCQMPVMDGFEATTTIRNGEKRGHHVPIIAVTANAFVSDKEKCIAAGMNDFFSKPFNQSQLSALIEQWIPKTGDEAVDSLIPEVVTDDQPNVMSYSMIDKKMVDGIVDTVVTELQFFQDLLVEYFSDDIPEKLGLFEQSFKQTDIGEMKKIVHSLRGSSAQLGAFVAAKHFEDMEACIFNNNIGNIPSMIGELEQILCSTKLEYDHYLMKRRMQ